MAMFSEYNIMSSLSVGYVDGADRDISDVLTSKDVVFVLMSLYMWDEEVL
jgi:hypothetical protein